MPGGFSAGGDLFEDAGQLVTEEDGDDGRRRLVGAEAVVVAGMGDDAAQQGGVFIDGLADIAKVEQEPHMEGRQMIMVLEPRPEVLAARQAEQSSSGKKGKRDKKKAEGEEQAEGVPEASE